MLHETVKSSSSDWVKTNKEHHFVKALCFTPSQCNEIIINLLKCSLQRPPAAAGVNATPSAFSLRWAEARRLLSCGLFSWKGQRRCQWPRCTYERSWPESLLLGGTCPPRAPCLCRPDGARQSTLCWRWCCGRFPDDGRLRSCFSSWWRLTGPVCSGGWHTGRRWLVEWMTRHMQLTLCTEEHAAITNMDTKVHNVKLRNSVFSWNNFNSYKLSYLPVDVSKNTFLSLQFNLK